ncbi:uncharacterized protein LOC119348464 [Triticum dicoccoides]|uniref:DUF1618 domain-containing protein n=1 Tax=Triticum turgidum subsp. durum TaxID=4567 RepID=A0A9R0R0Q6_TRITD|nr:uncharacterized protein LOC119348464 [Triticum dicoccoides]VAH20187.1 unnamed protein product [Triticum turgidum subsp. durum]
MPPRHLLRLSAAVSGGLRRSLTTAASHPPWAAMCHSAWTVGAPSAQVRLAEPPRISEVYVPEQLLKTGPLPDPDGDFVQGHGGAVCAASADGLLLVVYAETRLFARIVARQGGRPLRLPPQTDALKCIDPDHVPNVTRFVLNPLTHQITRLPDRVTKFEVSPLFNLRMGLLTQADRGHGPPDRFAVAELQEENLMLRFLSEKGRWENVAVSPCQPPSARRMKIDQPALAFGGRLWWVDVTWGAVSADPFIDRPELSFIELPRGSVLPARSPLPEADGEMSWREYRRVDASQGRLRYVEVSQKEPFLLSSFVLDNNGTGWTLEHRVALSKLWADGGHPWLPLPAGKTPQIELLDPLNANVVYLTVDKKHVIVVDMNMKKVIGSYLYGRDFSVPCVLPPWLGSSRIPSAGKDTGKHKTLSDVLVRSDIQ